MLRLKTWRRFDPGWAHFVPIRGLFFRKLVTWSLSYVASTCSAQCVSPVAHALLSIQIIVLQPLNVFTRLKIPLNTPADAIRNLPKPLETLLKHLGSFDVKTYYLWPLGRSTCDYCLSFEEFGLFALPRTLISYIRETAVVGLVTISSSGRERYRTLAVYWISTVSIKIPKNDEPVFMWHDNLYRLRQFLFLVLPPLVHILPPSASPAAMMNPTLAAIRAAEHNAMRLQLLRLLRGAVLRVPALRTRAVEWWADEARDGAWVREDEGVQELARKLGTGFDEGSNGEGVGPLRTTARNTVAVLKGGFAPSEYWKVPPP
ncbi:hypothetical protein B0H10DRAFT_2075222 [Mycena sp. CBHHK59/15]|nr:hypothetical protein B0H10DRAFT_2075222 [Mycena sp. CBHHK59/15]